MQRRMDDDIADDDGFAIEPESSEDELQRPAKIQKTVTTVGKLILCLIVVSYGGHWPTLWVPDDALHSSTAGIDDNTIVGIALTRWTYATADECKAACDWLFNAEVKRSRSQDHRGFLLYPVQCIARFADRIELPPDASNRDLMDLVRPSMASNYDMDKCTWSEPQRLQEIVSMWQESVEYCLRLTSIRFNSLFTRALLSYPSSIPFHITSLGLRVQRKCLVSCNDPSDYVLKSLISQVAKPSPQSVHRGSRGWDNMHRAPILVKWLKATSYIKQQVQSWEAATAFYDILAEHAGVKLHDVTEDLSGVNAGTLRWGRIKLDCCCNLLFRELFESIPDHCDIFIYLDSSPQVRGQELFAASWEIFDGKRDEFVISRRLMPLVGLGRDFLDATGKTLALLWLVFLLVGPTWQAMRRFCCMVKAIVTDMGTERLIHCSLDILPDFFELMLNSSEHVPLVPRLFPNCLSMPGWQHGWDLILRRTLLSLPFFPSFIAGLRAMVSFFRAPLLVDVFVRDIRSKGFGTIAQMVKALKVPSIAEWRWGTVAAACAAFSTIIGTLRDYFSDKLYKNSRDPTVIQRTRTALVSSAWAWQFKFICWLSNLLARIAAWGKGSGRRLADGSTDPKYNGRRLPESEKYITSELDAALQAANSWIPESWGCSQESLQQLQLCVRSMHHLAWLRHEYLRKIPWKMCRLTDPDVAKACIEQYDSGTSHCPLSSYFLSPDGWLRSHVDAVAAGGIASHKLVAEVRMYGVFPMDDSICETPHAVGNSIARVSRHCDFSWVAASMRLKQNLADINTWRHAVRADLQSLWLRYASILQLNPRFKHRNVRVSRKLFIDQVYQMGLMFLAPREAAGSGGASSSNAPIEDGSIGEPAAPSDVEDAVGDAAAGDDELLPPGPPTLSAEDLALMRDFLLTTLQRGMYVSVPVHSEEFPEQLDRRFMQVLSIEPKVVLPAWFKSTADEPKYLDLGVQHFEQHMQGHDDSDSKVDVFVFAEPTSFDWGECCPDDRRKFLQWEAVPSEIDGCTTLLHPRVLECAIPFTDPRCPALCLLDALHEQGWVGKTSIATHSSDAEKIFDSRNAVKAKSYFRCVMSSDLLYLHDIDEFKSGRPKTYYDYILKFRKLPERNRTMKQLRAEIDRAVEDASDFAVEDASDLQPMAIPKAVPIAADDGFAIEDACDTPGHVEPIVVPVHLPPAAPPEAAPGSPLPLAVPALPAHPLAPILVDAGEWPLELEGATLLKIAGRDEAGARYHGRLKVVCPVHGPGCHRSRSVKLCQGELGHSAALCYLGSWLQKALTMDEAEHFAFKPSMPDMQAYKASHYPHG